MLENVGRKIVLILSLLAIAVACIVVPASPFRLGLDLRGGTRLVYKFDFKQALEDGQITQEEYNDPTALMQKFIGIIRERVDPQGVLEPVIRSEGSNRVVIELPGAAELAEASVAVPLMDAEILATAQALILDTTDAEVLGKFPRSGGVIQIGDEKVRYASRTSDPTTGAENLLTGLERGIQGTTAARHSKGANVRLTSDDAIRNAIESTGEMGFYLAVEPADFGRFGTDMITEETKVNEWITANPGLPLEVYNRLAPEDGGPPSGLLWLPHRTEDRLVALHQPTEETRFTGEQLDNVRLDRDELGYPAVFFKFKPGPGNRFGNFTREHQGERMAITLNGEVATDPVINDPLPGQGIISGGARGFTRAEVDDLVTVLRSGSLRIKPELEYEERVGATLGDQYVKTGFTSALVGLVLVLVFMVLYYRRLGVFGCLSLLANLLLLMGALAFLQATITLPGIAGIILTVGMAVDANILIFERIREETLNGNKVMQSAKNGFEKALSTIVDANLTTLITAMILYYEGTGPIRGFATTLSIGIIASMFSALVITRVLVHLQVTKGITEFKMARLVSKTSIDFMSKSKVALAGSLVLILAGVGLFISLPKKDKFSIDFLGGFTVTTRTENPETIDTIRERVAALPGALGESEVKPILDSAVGDGYTQFRITGKTEGLASEGEGTMTGESEIREALADLLEKGPIVIESGDGTEVAGRLYFEESHPTADVVAALTEAGITAPTVEAVADREGIYTFSGSTQTARSRDSWYPLLSQTFANRVDSSDTAFRMADPIPNSAVVGSQVVGELRDKAIIAIVLSLFAVVMYIRLRFAEYSYGFAAVIALVHDVLITLGLLSVAIASNLIEAEISLPMIAAFLTIIGYSLNDTIVVFDRIRENLPRMKGPLATVLNTSINQTLSRTLLTSITTLVVVLILLFFNLGSRNVLEGFAFALAIGVLVGTYSSIFVASPALLWLESRNKRKGEGGGGKAGDKAVPATAQA